MKDNDMFYTLGKISSYDPFLAEYPGATKARGGFALSYERAIEVCRILNDDPKKLDPECDLPQGPYAVYELPECTADQVKTEMLIEPSWIGNKVWEE